MPTTLLKMSSISRKVFMALAGVFLLVFLLVHLSINLFLLRNDGGDWFNQAATFMSSNYFVKAFEFLLFGSFIFHMLVGVILKLQNWRARPVGYAVSGKATTSFFSRYMIWTGLAIFMVLVIHLINFYFVKLGLVDIPQGVSDKHDFYSMVILLFKNPLYCGIYYAWLLILGLHLYHAFQSVFQTLGMNHNKYTPAIKTAAALYAIIISLGFMIIPTYFLLFY